MLTDGLHHVRRAGGFKVAARAVDRRDDILVEPDEFFHGTAKRRKICGWGVAGFMIGKVCIFSPRRMVAGDCKYKNWTKKEENSKNHILTLRLGNTGFHS